MDAISAIESSVLFKRYIYICHPHMAKLYCKMKTISKFGKLILTLAILHNVPRVFDREYIILDFGKTFLRRRCLFKTLNFKEVNFELGKLHQSVCHVQFLEWVEAISVDLYFRIFYW